MPANNSPQLDYASAIGNLKTVYAGYENVTPKEYVLMKEFPFDSGNKVGDEYQFGVELTRPQGFTTAASGQFPLLNQPITRQIPKAKLRPFQHYLRDRVTYETLAQAATSEQAAKAELGATVAAMRDAMLFRQEVLSLYGQLGVAILGTISAATNTASITSQSWAAGFWAGGENMVLTVRDTAGNFIKDITAVYPDLDNLTVQFNPGDLAGVSATNVLWFQGGSSTTEMVGIAKILQNTTTLYNIDAASYSLWRGTNFNFTTQGASGEDLSFKRAIQLDSRIRSRGGMGDNLGLVNPDVMTTLMSSIEAARDFGGDQYKNTEMDRGTRRVRFFTPTGITEIQAHPLVKRGDFFSLRKDKWKRAGACDPTFDIPGEGGKVLFDLQDYPGKELRCMADNTWFTPKPGASGMITNITYQGSVSVP